MHLIYTSALPWECRQGERVFSRKTILPGLPTIAFGLMPYRVGHRSYDSKIGIDDPRRVQQQTLENRGRRKRDILLGGEHESGGIPITPLVREG